MARKLTTILACLVMAGAGLSLYFSLFPSPPPPDPRPHEALGEVVAREAVKLLGAGGRVVLICRDTSMFRNPAADLQVARFVAVVGQSGARIAATNLIKLDPLRPVGVPPGDFLQILRRAAVGDTVVSFLGPPTLNDDQIGKLGEQRPPVIAVCSGGMPGALSLARLFERKLLHVAIVSRREVAASPPTSAQAQDWFDHLFTLLTSASPADPPSTPAPVPRP